jgi:hypothetical protein
MPPLRAIEFPKCKKDVWPIAVPKSYPLSCLLARAGMIVVAGRWTQYKERNCETITVVSALASQSRSGALTRALASTRNPYDHVLPMFRSSDEIRHGDFVLEGWVEESGAESGADSDDPWNGGLARRFKDLAGPVAAELGVVSDDVSGTWRQSDGTCVAWVERWSEGPDDERDRNPSGHRLLVDKRFLQKALDRWDRTLILEVTCRRQVVPFRYENRSEDEHEEHSTSIISIEKSGPPRVVGHNAHPRQKARRRTKAR